MIPSYIPSPSESVWYLGPVPIRAYALFILVGIFVAIWLGQRRLSARGGPDDAIMEMAVWAVPCGIIGGRLYHVISSPDAYFGEGGNPMKALYVWHGGLGIWGAVALGIVGVWIGARQQGVALPLVLDSLAPAVLIAQGIGRLGNYFNQELFGKPTDLPWGLMIDPANRPLGFEQFATYHPTFLYELLWNFAGAAFLIVVGNRLDWRGGQVFFAYIVTYTVGRLWIEALRIDPAHNILGVRLNMWTSVIVMVFGIVGFLVARRGAQAARNLERSARRRAAQGRGQRTAGFSDQASTGDTPRGGGRVSGDSGAGNGGAEDQTNGRASR